MKKVLCKCGCKQETPITNYWCKERKKGTHLAFIHGHNRRGKKWDTPPMLGKKHSLETRRKMIISSRKGSDSNLWRGGVYKDNELQRRSSEYRIWRASVYERDNYTCIWCGYRGNCLQADHIQSFAAYPNLRFEISNGRTLCIDCHKKTETYGTNLRYIQ